MRKSNENYKVEFFWTLIPAIISIIPAIPSTNYLYKFDTFVNFDIGEGITIKVIGSQWFWFYDFTTTASISSGSIAKNEIVLSDFILEYLFVSLDSIFVEYIIPTLLQDADANIDDVFLQSKMIIALDEIENMIVKDFEEKFFCQHPNKHFGLLLALMASDNSHELTRFDLWEIEKRFMNYSVFHTDPELTELLLEDFSKEQLLSFFEDLLFLSIDDVLYEKAKSMRHWDDVYMREVNKLFGPLYKEIESVHQLKHLIKSDMDLVRNLESIGLKLFSIDDKERLFINDIRIDQLIQDNIFIDGLIDSLVDIFSSINDVDVRKENKETNLFESIVGTCEYDSMLLHISNFDLKDGKLRSLETTQPLYLPIHTPIRFIITSRDVLHCSAVPSLGIKMDACPGRLNQVLTIPNREGIFYGQRSELRGVNHAFMPIQVIGVPIVVK